MACKISWGKQSPVKEASICYSTGTEGKCPAYLQPCHVSKGSETLRCVMCHTALQWKAGWWQSPFVSVIVITNLKWWRAVIHGSRDTSTPQKNLGYSCLFSVGRPWALTRALQINLFMLIIQNWTWIIIRPDTAAKLWPVAKINPRTWVNDATFWIQRKYLFVVVWFVCVCICVSSVQSQLQVHGGCTYMK